MYTVDEEVAEVLVWGEAIDDGEIEHQERCLCQKYGISSGPCAGAPVAGCPAPICPAAPRAPAAAASAAGRRCAACGVGLVCEPGNGPPWQEAGFRAQLVNGSNGTQEYTVYLCPLGPAACPHGPAETCAGGTFGVMCVECPMAPKWTYWSTEKGRCVDCSGEGGTSAWLLPVALLCLVFAMCVVYCFALPPAGSRGIPMAMDVAVALGQLLNLL